ncbi:HlyD family efflux transporter periplasmic adaptor subunit [Candidatus Trichorickettsia mobilis]|uniref:HlyD family efflux transporter periplasmic adaptor subunit n=1 Tax=Candidatus Trichorickettsia mobilis TaxID=1346319 RepID=UPI00292D9B80|nr:HlyD family efflux transporter periplasmic adaptor subunit [Candidatus Trichorickettsia mobilis]
MTAQRIMGLSFLLLCLLIVISNFIYIEIFSRAQGEVVPYNSIAKADFFEAGIISKISVQEGDHVNEGQVLAELDAQEYSLQTKLLSDKIQYITHKIDLLKGLLVDQQKIIINNENKVLGQSNFDELRENYIDQIKNFQDLLAADAREYDVVQALIAKGSLAKMTDITIKQRVLKDEQSLVKAIKDFEEKIIFEMEKYIEQKQDLENNLKIYQVYLERSTLKAPANGVIEKIYFEQDGQYAAKGATFADIIEDTTAKFKIQLKVSTDKIGKIHENAPVYIRVNTYDHGIFGTIMGKIINISINATEVTQSEKFYLIDVLPEKPYLTYKNKTYPLKYGMSLYGTIGRGKVSAFAYFMKPVIESFNDIGAL